MYDIAQVESIYDSLTAKVKADLNEQFNQGRIKGSDYANVYAQLMGQCLQLAFQAPLNEKQALLYERQKQGFDDNLKQKMLEIQLNAWSMMFSSGMLSEKPSIITNDEASVLYNNLKAQLGI